MHLGEQKLLVGASLLDTKAALGLRGVGTEYTTHYCVWGPQALGGEVSIEAADDPAFAGAWQLLDKFTFTIANKVDAKRVDGSHRAIRHRVSSAIIGDTVTTRIILSGAM